MKTAKISPMVTEIIKEEESDDNDLEIRRQVFPKEAKDAFAPPPEDKTTLKSNVMRELSLSLVSRSEKSLSDGSHHSRKPNSDIFSKRIRSQSCTDEGIENPTSL